MREATIFYKDESAATLLQYDDGSFSFTYHKAWLDNSSKPPISLTLPKREGAYHSPFLFPFFYNMLPEGSNKELVCKYNKIDSEDYFGLLLTTAGTDTIGAVTVQKPSNA